MNGHAAERVPAPTAAARSPAALADRGALSHGPTTPVIPNALLQLMTEEDAVARAAERVWEHEAPATAPGAGGAPSADAEPAPVLLTPEPAGSEQPGSGRSGTEEAAEAGSGEGRLVEETEGGPGKPRAEQGKAPGADQAAQGAEVGAGAPAEGAAAAPGAEQSAVPGEEAQGEEVPGEVDLRGSSGLEAWGSKVRAATAHRLRAPRPADPTPTTAAISERTGQVVRRESVRRRGALSDLRTNLPVAPAIPTPTAPPALPRPDVEAKVAGASGKKLPDQVLPRLVDYTHTPATGKPQVFKPRIAALRLPEGSSSTVTPVPEPRPLNRAERRRAAKAREAATAEVVPAAAQGAFTLGSLAAPGTAGAVPAPPVHKVDIAGVLARLRLAVTDDSAKMLRDIRTEMFPLGALQYQLPTLGSELEPDLQARMRKAIDVITTQAGIDLAVVHNAQKKSAHEVTLGAEIVKARVTAAEKEGKDTAAAEGKSSTDTVAGAVVGAEQQVDATLLTAQGGASVAEIRAQRDRLMARVRRRLAPEDLRYEREGEDRLRALSLMASLYTAAYLDVARQVADRVRRDAAPGQPSAATVVAPVAAAPDVVTGPTGPDAPAWSSKAPTSTTAAPVLMVTPAEAWGVERVREVRSIFTVLRSVAVAAIADQRAGIVVAENYAKQVLGEWMETEIGDREGFWAGLWEEVQSWSRDALDRTQAWEEARSAQLGADLRGDLSFVAELASGARSKAEVDALGTLGALSKAQQAIATAYFTGEPPRDPLGAVAVGMRMRIAEVHRPRITEELRRQLYGLPKDRWHDVAVVAESEGGGVVIAARGDQFHASVDQWGTDESKLYAALTGLTALQRHALDLWYQQVHGSTIDKELRDELEDAELDRAQALMAGNQVAADAATIRDAIEGAGTDEDAIYRTLRIKDPTQRKELEDYYAKKYGKTLEADLKDDMDGEELARANALREGNQRKADAIGLEMAKTGKWHGGADTGAIAEIYALNRTEVEQEAVAGGWTSERLQREKVARNAQIDVEHRKHYTAAPGAQGAGLEASFSRDLRGPALELALGLHQVDLARADAALLEIEKRGIVTDDKVVTKILESQYDRAELEVRLDQEHRLAYRQDLAAVRGQDWDDVAERKAMEAGIRTEAAKRGKENMAQLKKTYDDRWANDPMSAQHGHRGFDQLITHGLQGSDEDRARALIESGGRLNPAQEIKYAVQGAGTDVDVLKRMLEGKTKAEILEIKRQWKELYPNGPTLEDRIMDDVSGRDAVDLSEMLAAPETPEELLASAKRRQKFEAETFSLGSVFGKAERTRLDSDVARLEQMVAEHRREIDPANPDADPERAKFLRWRVDQEKKSVDSAIEEHRRNADSVTDTLVMITAIVAGAVVTALTWGAAGPFVAAGLGALAAAEATILTKLAVKGDAYSQEEILVDVVTGVVDVILAVSTAGIGNALMRVKQGVPVGRLARLATSASRAKRMVAHGLANGVEGAISGLPSGAAGAIADEKTWSQGNVLGTVLTASGMGAVTGAGMGGAIGSAGGWKAVPVPLNLPAGSNADAAARAAQWHTHSQQHPSASYADFVNDLDAGRIKPDLVAAADFTKATREALTAGLSAEERKGLADVTVSILSDAEFARVTRSAKGDAVTIVENGKPRVVMRESAPLSALREEGIHVAQALDPELAGHFKLLDEALLAGWDNLPLEARLAAYAAKLDLEVDANARLLRGLAAEAEALPQGAARRSLVEQVAEIADSLDTLVARRAELGSFGVLDRLAARLGTGTLAERLSQPARLFTKATKKAAKAAKKLQAATAAMGAPPDPATAPRRALLPHERSPQSGQKGVLAVRQVGDPWVDVSFRGKQRTPGADSYRMVEVDVVDAKTPGGFRTKRFHETVVRGSNPPRWVKRGSHAALAGEVAEEASLARTRRYIQQMRRKGLKVVTMGGSLQNESGQGFDEVYFEFHPGNRVEVVLVEVKDYPGRRVPFGDFTAVTGDILKDNLEKLRNAVMLPRDKLPPALAALTDVELKSLRKKLATSTNAGSGLTLEVRLGPTTGLGGQKQQRRQDAALRKLQRRFRSRTVRQDKRLTTAEVDLASRVKELELPEASIARLLDTHATLAARGVVDPLVVPVAGQPGVFTGPSGKVTTFRAVTPDDVGGKTLDKERLASLAEDTVKQLQRQLSPAAGSPAVPLQVVLDLTALDAGTRRQVLAAIDAALAHTRQASSLRTGLHVEPRPRRVSGTRP